MKIPLGNRILNIEFNVFTTPNYNKLEKELSDYFNRYTVCGHKIKRFSLSKDFTNAIIPAEPNLEDSLDDGAYVQDLKNIGERYGIKDLGFIHWCYHE